jgi:hypothetical protein
MANHLVYGQLVAEPTSDLHQAIEAIHYHSFQAAHYFQLLGAIRRNDT